MVLLNIIDLDIIKIRLTQLSFFFDIARSDRLIGVVNLFKSKTKSQDLHVLLCLYE